MFKEPQNLNGLTVNLVQGLSKQCSHVQTFCFFAESNLMDSSYVIWNKFQDYQLMPHSHQKLSCLKSGVGS